MSFVLLRFVAASFSLALVWLASQALDAGGPAAVVAIAILIYAVAELLTAILRNH